MRDGDTRSRSTMCAADPSRGMSPPRALAAWRLDVGTDAFALLEWPTPGHADRALTGALTAAEAAIVRRAVTGWPNARIARARGRSPRTIANQLASAFRKLGVRSRLELCALAARDELPSAGEAREGR